MLLVALIVFASLFALFGLVAVKDVVTIKKRHRKFNVKTSIAAYGMLLPAVILGFFFIMLPIVYSLAYAFTDYYLLKPEQISFIGFENFAKVISELKDKSDLYNAILNTLTFVVIVTPLQIGLALGMSLFVNRKKVAIGVFKVAFFAPVVISLTITSFLWKQILWGSETGMINAFLKMFGVAPIDHLGKAKTAMVWIAILSAWQGCGYQMLIFLSGLSNIRKELYEAASLDGAGVFRQFWNITVPGLRSTFLFIVVTVFIGACRVMIQPMIMTGYQTHTVTLSYYMYQQGVIYRKVGYSSAVALIMTIIIGSITFIQRRLLREKD